MCVIFGVAKGNVVPFDQYLKPASLRNRDGWGASYTDRGKFIVERFFEGEKGNDPEKIAKWLEETKEFDRCLHVRFTTRGNKCIENVHPFRVLDPKDFGEGLVLYHNGTLSSWGSKDISDSNEFATNYVKPIAERFMRGTLAKDYKLLEDPLFRKLLEAESNYGSVITLHHQDGTILNFDKSNSIKRYPDLGFWSSNDAYFDIKRTTSNYYSQQGGSTNYTRSAPFQERTLLEHTSNQSSSQSENASVSKDSQGSQTTTSNKSNSHVRNDAVTDWFTSILSVNENFPVIPSDHDRDTFFSLAGLKDFDDIRYMGPEEIQELIERFPECATVLIQDLIWLYVNHVKAAKAAKSN